jgi:hypothetical protein
MSETPYLVGYGRPPGHTRFRKGHSGNPGGRPGPKKLAKQAFDAALGKALNGSKQALRDAKPAKVIEAFARKVALDALDGRSSAQRLLLSILEREDCGAGDGEISDETAAAARAEESAGEHFGDRYDEFNRRFKEAVAAESVEDLRAIVRDFGRTDKIPRSGNSEGILQSAGAQFESSKHEDRGAADGESSDKDEDDDDGDAFVFDGGEHVRQLLGERYDAFKRRCEAAVNTGSVDDLVAVIEEIDRPAKFPQSANS